LTISGIKGDKRDNESFSCFMRVAMAHEGLFISFLFSLRIYSLPGPQGLRGTNNKINQKYGYIEGL
jgi:hypothetical protein